MATSQTKVESRIIELSTAAFDTFCEDISGMFGVGMKCTRQDHCDETIEGLNKRFDKLVSINSIKAEGALDGHFQVVLGKEGLFTLAGVIVMLPEQRILSNRKHGAAKDAEEMDDAISEAGNLLVGSWDRVFRKEFEGHDHFAQTGTFIGNPWDDPKKKIGLAKDEVFLFIPYKMTIDPYPEFDCGVIFPKAIFGEPEPEASEDENTQQAPEETEDQAEAADKAESTETDAPTEDDSEESKSQAPDEDKEAETEEVAKSTEENKESQDPDESTTEQEPKADDAEPVTSAVSESIQKMTQSSADLPGGSGVIPVGSCANDIMQTDVIWGNPDDSVEQALAKMQQTNSSYMLVGTDECPEGIVSTFDIASALSIYLKPMFAKWHRPLDDATLQIKIKWIMTRPVHTITPDTSLMAIMDNMCRASLRCLPVVTEQGKAVGLVTVFDVFNAMQNTDSGLSTVGKAPQGPVLA